MNEIIKSKLEQLEQLVERYPDAIPVPEAAKYCGIDPQTLRDAIDAGTCPFGWAKTGRHRKGYVILTVQFYLNIVGSIQNAAQIQRLFAVDEQKEATHDD